MLISTGRSSLVASAIGLCLALPGYAQTNAEPATKRESVEVEEIIVTARRREERLQDVPISITVFNQQQLSDRNVVNAGDLATYTPSLVSNSRFGAESTSFAIRGFIQEGPTAPSVAVYFADVTALRANGGTTAGNGAGPGSFFDLQNVQVLKGPQGTLFGRNTTGGAVLLVPQKPTGDVEGYVEASAGNYNLQRMQGVLNLPLGDSFRVRAGVDWNTRDGYLNNVAFVPGVSRVGPKDFADVDYLAARVSAVWDITPNLENYTIASYSDSDTNGFVPKMTYATGAGYRGANYLQQVAALRGDYYDVSNGNPDARQRIEQWQAINTTTWNFTDTMTLKNIISYGEFQQAQAAMIYGDNGVTAGTPLHYNYAVNISPRPGKHNVSQSTFTEELQLQGRLGSSFNYQIGGYYEYAKPLDGFQETYSGIYLDCIDLLSLQCTDMRGRLTPGPAPLPNLEGRIGSASISRSEYTFRNRGLYLQGTYEFTDQFSLTAGVRYTSDDTSGLGQPLRINFPATNTPVFGCANPPPLTQGGTSAQVQADPARCNIARSQSSDEPTWLIDFDYKPTEDVLLYAKYARGYRQGSVNVSSYGLETWGPEQVDTYEIGTKLGWDAAVSGLFNIAVFYNDFTDQQLALGTTSCTSISLPQCPFVPSPAQGIANAGKSTIKGVEVEAVFNLFRGFRVDLAYAYLDSKIDEITLPPPPPGFTALTAAAAGGPIPQTPENKYTATISYTLPLPESIGRLTVSATGSHQDEMLGATSSIPSGLYELPEQELVNVNFTWDSIAGLPVDLNLFATNVTEEEFHTYTTGASFGFDSLIVNEPRMYGARVKYRFGSR